MTATDYANDLPLFEKAKDAVKNAYVPYSNFPVGACLRTTDGYIFQGCNIENASFGLTNCAERTALFAAIAARGEAVKFDALAIYGKTEKPISPCGACRQVLAEHCSENMPVFLLSKGGEVLKTTIGELLPYSFSKLS